MGVWAQEQSTCEIASVVSNDNTPNPFFRMINAFAEHIDNLEFETRLASVPQTLSCTLLDGVFSLSQRAPTIDTMLVWQKTPTVNNCPDVMSRFVTALPQTKSGLVAHGS